MYFTKGIFWYHFVIASLGIGGFLCLGLAFVDMSQDSQTIDALCHLATYLVTLICSWSYAKYEYDKEKRKL
jgi:hypothetical protein